MVCGITVGRKTIAGRSTSRSKKGERYRGRRRECVLLTMRVVYRPRRVLRQCLRLALYLKERISSQPESFASVSSFWFGVESPIGWVVISFVFIFFFFSLVFPALPRLAISCFLTPCRGWYLVEGEMWVVRPSIQIQSTTCTDRSKIRIRETRQIVFT